jgi:VWFA-related protein
MRSWWTGAVATAVVCATGLPGAGVGDAPPQQNQQPVFRTGVDLVRVEVEVVDSAGAPIATLGPEKFTVTIDGRRRPVVTSQLVQHGQMFERNEAARTAPAPSAPQNDPGTSRVFMLAVDIFSFSLDATMAVAKAAKGFIAQLDFDDYVGLYTFPVGSRIAATRDHGAVSRRLDTLVGQESSVRSAYNLNIGEIVDIVAEETAAGARATAPGADMAVTRRVMARECPTANDLNCMEAIQTEAQALSFYLETRINQGVSGLRSLVQILGEVPGRKTVVVLTGGMPVSDRLGGRPDIGEVARTLGQDAARANTIIYAVYVDSAYVRSFSADRRRYDRQSQNPAREHAMMGRLIDAFAGSSGGTMLTAVLGGGEQAFARILRETASHYLLGVEPAEADRDGQLRRLNVKVDHPNTTVRSRQWVVVPKRGGS